MLVSALLIGVNADAAKKKSSKRASSTRKSSKRSASSKKGLRSVSLKRAAATSNATRTSSANTRRASAVSSKGTSGIAQTTTSEKKNGTLCPVGKVLKLEEDSYYFAKNKTCNAPENAHEEFWTPDSKLKKLSWIDESEAVYFSCDDGYIENKGKCVDGYTVCPLDVAITKKGNSFLNPNTDESCSMPVGAFAKHATNEEAEEYGLTDSSAYVLQCKENYYSTTLDGMDGYVAKCEKCPEGTTSPAGSTSKNACVSEVKEEVSENNSELEGLKKQLAEAEEKLKTETEAKTAAEQEIEKQKAEAAAKEKVEAEKNKYLHPVSPVNKTITGGVGSVSLGVGCYKVSAYGAGGGASGNALFRWGQAGGEGAVAKAWFCVSSGTANLTYSIGQGGNGGNVGKAGANGGDTSFTVTGNLDSKFSGISSGASVSAKGGYGGSGTYSVKTSVAAKGTCSGLITTKTLPSEYSYIKTGFGTSPLLFSILTVTNTATTKLASCGFTSNGGSLGPALKAGNAGGSGKIVITTIVPKIAMY